MISQSSQYQKERPLSIMNSMYNEWASYARIKTISTAEANDYPSKHRKSRTRHVGLSRQLDLPRSSSFIWRWIGPSFLEFFGPMHTLKKMKCVNLHGNLFIKAV